LRLEGILITPTLSQDFADTGLKLDDFVPDAPFPPAAAPATANDTPRLDLIDGVGTTPLLINADPRGSLCELLTMRDDNGEPIVHVYQVIAAPGSIRAWVYHTHQFDRLVFTMGTFEVALYDARPHSPTANRLNVFALGAARPCLLRIPPFVIHGVRNAGSEPAAFMNMPTEVYRRETPDKSRLRYGDPRVPFLFDAR
jgi:dTDP-4-dehydrorhamnose 3,5-epimerase